jgi:catechol 2,3-dioxygenase-like lactoylglutathione lyase family enzyme
MNRQLDSLISGFEDGTISRRQLLAALTAMTVIPLTARPSGFVGRSLNHVTLSVSDVDRSRKFYESVLGVSVISTQENGVNLGLGDSFLGLYRIDDNPGIHHFCVGLENFNLDEAADRLRAIGISPYIREDKPEVYFQDPDGITVQFEDRGYRG